MLIERAESITTNSSQEKTPVSFSEYQQLSVCRLKAFLLSRRKNLGSRTAAKVDRYWLQGMVMHSILKRLDEFSCDERRETRSQIRKAIHNEIQKFAGWSSPNDRAKYESWGFWANLVRLTESKIYDYSIEALFREKKLVTSDGNMLGVVDLIERLENGYAIVDYKSSIKEDLTDAHIQQLNFYACLCEDRFQKLPIKMEVELISGTRLGVEVNPLIMNSIKSTCAEYISDTSYALSINNLGLLGTTNTEVCETCSCAFYCPFVSSKKILLKNQISSALTIRVLKRKIDTFDIEILSGILGSNEVFSKITFHSNCPELANNNVYTLTEIEWNQGSYFSTLKTRVIEST